MFYTFTYASVTSNHRPRTILAPVRFLAPKAEWSTRRNITPVPFSWSHQATGPVQFDTVVYTLMAWSNNSHGHRTGPARESPMFFIPYGTRTGPMRDPLGCRTESLRRRKGIGTTRICKIPARASYVAMRGPHGSLTVPARAVESGAVYDI